MAILAYDKYVIISRPEYDYELKAWIPYASAGWGWGGGERFHFKQFTDLGLTFESEEESFSFGFLIARDWVEEQKKTG